MEMAAPHPPLADPHPTSNKAQTVSTPPLTPRGRGEQAGWWGPSLSRPASVAMATEDLAVGTVGLLGVLSRLGAAEGGKGRQGQGGCGLFSTARGFQG